MKTLLRLFFQGLLVLLPVVLTVYLLWLIATTLDNLLFSAIGHYAETLLGRELPQWLRSILGLTLVLGLILLTGILTSIYLGRFLLQQLDRVLQRIPLVRLLYTSLSDLFKALLGDHRGFDRPGTGAAHRRSGHARSRFYHPGRPVHVRLEGGGGRLSTPVVQLCRQPADRVPGEGHPAGRPPGSGDHLHRQWRGDHQQHLFFAIQPR